jgi:hypothetical protein
MKPGVKVEMAFDTMDGKSDSIINTTVFFRRKSSYYREMTEEFLYTNFNSIYSQEKKSMTVQL